MGEKILSRQENYRRLLATWEQILRKHQDTIFSSLYSDPECVLDLYFTLHPEDKDSGLTLDQIEIITLENAFLARRYNDVAFRVRDRLIVLVEHQSTINENMPLRMLFYIAKEYEKTISSIKEKLYKEKRISIPKPEFYIVYTGKETWKTGELKLSEAYGVTGSEEIPLELKVHVISKEDVQTTQNTLGSYYDFIIFIKENAVNSKIYTEAVENYIRKFAGSELFKKFLERLSAGEVMQMENYEFDMELALKVWREEAMEDGMEKGMEKAIRSLMENMKLSLDQAMDALNIPMEEQSMYADRILITKE